MRWESLARCAVVASLALLTACGGGPGGQCGSDETGVYPNCMKIQCPSGQVGTYPNCQAAKVVVSQGTGYPLEANFLGSVPFTTSEAGTLEATVDWTYPENDIDVFIVRDACTFDQFVALECNVVAFAISETTKPEVATAPASPAGQYTLFVGNAGPGDETTSFQVVLTRDGTSSTPPSASSRSPEVRVPGLKAPWRGMVEF